MSHLRINNLEGHYTIKRLKKLPKKGNSNWLYTLEKDNMTIYYLWNLKNEWEQIKISDSISSLDETLTTLNISGTDLIYLDENNNSSVIDLSFLSNTIGNLPIFDSYSQAQNNLSVGSLFKLSENNIDGVPSPNSSTVLQIT